MHILKKLLANSALMSILLGMLFLPIGAMGLMNLKQTTGVLSETDYVEETAAPSNYEVFEEPQTYAPETYETTSSPYEWQNIDN